MLFRFFYRYAALAFGCTSSIFSYAQTPAPDVPEIVVTANPALAADPAPAQRLDGAALLQRAPGGLGEALNGLPGVASTYFGSAASRPVVRGLEGDRIRVLNNGALSSDASGLSFDHAVASSVLATDGIELVRGPAALMYGSSAVGGVVNLLDNRIAKNALFDAKGGRLGRVQAGVGSGARERTGAALLESGTDQYALHLDVFTSKSQELSSPVPITCTQGEVTRAQNKICNSQSQSAGGALGASLFFNQAYVGASIDRTEQMYGSPAQANVNLKMERTSYRLEGEKKGLSGWLHGLRGHLVSHHYQHREMDAGVVGTTFSSSGLEAKLQAQSAPYAWGTNQLQTLAGWQREQTRFLATGEEAFVPRTLTQSQALYALQTLTAAWGKLTLGGRTERANVDSLGMVDNTNFTPTQRSLSAHSLALGSLLKLNHWLPGLTLSGDVARSARIPKDYELYASGEHAATGAFEQGNADLAVERSTHVELGLKWQSAFEGRRRFDQTSFQVFSTRFDNYIYLQSTGATSAAGSPVLQYAQTAAKFSGWEWDAQARLVQPSADQPKALDLQARASMVQANNTATGEPLPRIAPLRVGLTGTVSQDAWKWTLGADRAYAQNRVPTAHSAIAGYTLWSVGFSYDQKNASAGLGRALWFASLRNATNALAYPASSILTQTAPGRVPLPGRSLQLGLQLSF